MCLEKWCFISECAMAEDDEYRLEVLIHLPDLVRLDKDEYLPEDRTEALALKQKKEEDAVQKLVSKCRKKVQRGVGKCCRTVPVEMFWHSDYSCWVMTGQHLCVSFSDANAFRASPSKLNFWSFCSVTPKWKWTNH